MELLGPGHWLVLSISGVRASWPPADLGCNFFTLSRRVDFFTPNFAAK